MELQVGVKAFLRNREGKFLLLKRNAKKYTDVEDEVWDIVGGRVEAGKPLIENLKREVWEEARLELKETPKLIAAQDILHIATRHVVRLTYLGKIEGEPQLDADHTDAKWFSIEELKQLNGIDRFVKELIDKKLIA